MKKTLGLMAVLTALGGCDTAAVSGSNAAAPANVTPDDCALDVPNRPATATCENNE
ncbi:hypothetical protein OCH239_03505 [Roseivivax halodurans JCM 10272]|uniref:Lipoprotein n=1 Tax=Roseivivax halodurans JCM 10272 TaxID=1449350 RepID=X7EED2_9RHOB|nr:hypothetical protein [Roseivivax halodurans]ETX14424.1 hypothetical protein OCH239_03505 [Roseivivax halodurans JCM 10272]